MTRHRTLVWHAADAFDCSGHRVCGAPIDRLDDPALELGRLCVGPIRFARLRPDDLLHRGRPRAACGLEERGDLSPTNGRLRPLCAAGAAPPGVCRSVAAL